MDEKIIRAVAWTIATVFFGIGPPLAALALIVFYLYWLLFGS